MQSIINSSILVLTKFISFELLTGVKIKNKTELKIIKILCKEHINCVMKHLEKVTYEARKNIINIQEENERQFNKSLVKPKKYEIGDVVAIQRTQVDPGFMRLHCVD